MWNFVSYLMLQESRGNVSKKLQEYLGTRLRMARMQSVKFRAALRGNAEATADYPERLRRNRRFSPRMTQMNANTKREGRRFHNRPDLGAEGALFLDSRQFA